MALPPPAAPGMGLDAIDTPALVLDLDAFERNLARMAVLLAGLPDTVPGSTINRLCASSLDAINIAARMIETGHGDVFIAGGVESMSRAPFVMAKGESAFDRRLQAHDTTMGWRFTNPKLAELYYPYGMGETAENVAKKYALSRQEQDQFAYESQMKCKAAMEAGRFNDEIVAVEVPQRKGDPIVVERDEHPRPDTTLEGLAKLKPALADAPTHVVIYIRPPFCHRTAPQYTAQRLGSISRVQP